MVAAPVLRQAAWRACADAQRKNVSFAGDRVAGRYELSCDLPASLRRLRPTHTISTDRRLPSPRRATRRPTQRHRPRDRVASRPAACHSTSQATSTPSNWLSGSRPLAKPSSPAGPIERRSLALLLSKARSPRMDSLAWIRRLATRHDERAPLFARCKHPAGLEKRESRRWNERGNAHHAWHPRYQPMRSAARLRAPPPIRDAPPIHTDGRSTLDAGRAQERTSRFGHCDERARVLTGRSGCTLRTWIATSGSASSVSSRIKPGCCGIQHWFVSLTSLELEEGIALAGRVSMTGGAAS